MGTSDILVLAAVGIAFVVSVSLWFSGYREEGLFVGLWVPSGLALASNVRIAIRTRR